ncbi:MAG: (d)CMP kinase [Kiritimatiellia bacterium]|nr:(d)CMP kinase [Kiritimatiellia bacterium]
MDESKNRADRTLLPLRVAIDGPAASGKSTVAREVARRLGATVVDSGAWYRGMTWAALRAGADVRDPASVRDVMRRARWETKVENGAVTLTLDGENPGEALRSEAVRESVSDIAAIPEVRVFIVDRLRETTRHGAVVMEGRDIGTVVFPDTPYKFYLDADPEERARRRLREIVALEGRGDVGAVLDSLQRRDRKDRTRAADPLRVAPDAVVLDSTALSVAEVVEIVLAAVRRGQGAA